MTHSKLAPVLALSSALFAWACGGSNSSSTGCTATQTSCAQMCIDLTSDTMNCGACGTSCSTGQICSASKCILDPHLSCDNNFIVCSGTCVDAKSDRLNCGSCTHACTGVLTCTAGVCVDPCAPKTTCTSSCVDLTSDASNCGTCGNACTDNFVCSSGQCMINCPSTTPDACPETGTPTYCANLQTDAANCGTCGNSCGIGASCTSGGCICPAGSHGGLCSGTCVDFSSDASHCGDCNTACNTGMGQVCRPGGCGCPGAQPMVCGGQCVDLSNDVNHCGGCNTVCGGGTPYCVNSVCTSSTAGNGLVGLWNLNETTTGTAPSGADFTDDSGNGNYGTKVGTITLGTSGVIGNAIVLDGSTGYVTIADSASLEPVNLTMAAWIKLSALPNHGATIVSKSQKAAPWSLPYQSWMIRINDATHIEAAVGSSSTYSSASGSFLLSTALTASTWYHVAVTYDGATVICYLNGVSVGTKSFTGPVAYGPYPVLLGADFGASPATDYFPGSIDQAGVWNRALSSTEVTQLYGAGSGVALTCPSASFCSSACVNLQTDANHCGNCATVCGGGTPYCNSGVCSARAKHFVYVANINSAVNQYSLSLSTGLLSALSPSTAAAGSGEGYLVVHPTGKWAYVSSGSKVYEYSINQSTGALTALATASIALGAGVDAEGITVDSTGRWLYALNRDANSLSQYAINQTTGILSALSPATVATGTGPQSLALDPTGHWAYVANLGTNNISQYSIDQSLGGLTPISTATVAAGSGPYAIAVDGTGHWAYVGNSGSANVSQYSINQSTGALIALTPATIAAGSNPAGITVDPSSHHVYVANNQSNNVSQYSIDQGTGALTALAMPSAAAGADPIAVVVDSTGKWAYVSNGGAGTLSQYAIDATTGALTALSTATVSAGSYPFGIAIY